MRGSALGAGLRRLGRLLLGRNELRRPTDRIEGVVVAFLAAALLAAVVAAASFAGHLYWSERAVAARLRPAVTAPAINQAPAGASVPGRLDSPGRPVPFPPRTTDPIADALVAGISGTAGAALVLTLCYFLCRVVLGRHRLAKWEAAWAATGPRWTSRR